MAKVIVEIPAGVDHRWKSWRKTVTGVDTAKTDGYAFEGSWLKAGELAELEVGTLVLFYDEIGSAKYHQAEVDLRRVIADPGFESVRDDQGNITGSGRSWALAMRDRAAAALTAQQTAETPTSDEDDGPLLLQDAVIEIASAIQQGWSKTDDFTVETIRGSGDVAGIEVDLPPTGQTIHITIDIRPRA